VLDYQSMPKLSERMSALGAEESAAIDEKLPTTSAVAGLAGAAATGGVENIVGKAIFGRAFLKPAVQLIGGSLEGGFSGAMATPEGATGAEYLNNFAFSAAVGAAMGGAFIAAGAGVRALKPGATPSAGAWDAVSAKRSRSSAIELHKVFARDGMQATADAIERRAPTPELHQEVIQMDSTTVLPPGQALRNAQRLSLDPFATPEQNRLTSEEYAARRHERLMNAPMPEDQPLVEALWLVVAKDEAGKVTGVDVHNSGTGERTPLKTRADLLKIGEQVRSKNLSVGYSKGVSEALAFMDMDSAELVNAALGRSADAPEFVQASHAVIVRDADGVQRMLPGNHDDAVIASFNASGIQTVQDDLGVVGLAHVNNGIASPIAEGSGLPSISRPSQVRPGNVHPVTPEVVQALRENTGLAQAEALRRAVPVPEIVPEPTGLAKTFLREDGITPEIDGAIARDVLQFKSTVGPDGKPALRLTPGMLRKFYKLQSDEADKLFLNVVKDQEELFIPAEDGESAIIKNEQAAKDVLRHRVDAFMADQAAEQLAHEQVRSMLPEVRIVSAPPPPDVLGLKFDELVARADFLAPSQEMVLPIDHLAKMFNASHEEVMLAAEAAGARPEYGESHIAARDMGSVLHEMTNNLGGPPVEVPPGGGPPSGGPPPPPPPPGPPSDKFPLFISPGAWARKHRTLGEMFDLVKAVHPDSRSALDKGMDAWLVSKFDTWKANPSARTLLNATANSLFGTTSRAPQLIAGMHTDALGAKAVANTAAEMAAKLKQLFPGPAAADTLAKGLRASTPEEKADFARSIFTSQLGQKHAEMIQSIRDEIDANSAEIKKRTGIDPMATVSDEAMLMYSTRMFGKYLLPDNLNAQALTNDAYKFNKVITDCAKEEGLSFTDAYNLVIDVATVDQHQGDMGAAAGPGALVRHALTERKQLKPWQLEAMGEVVKDGPLMVAFTLAKQRGVLARLDMLDRWATDARIASITPKPAVEYGTNGRAAKWEKVPDNKAAWGNLAGLYVHPAAFQELNAMQTATSQANAVVREIINWQKTLTIPLGGVRVVTTGQLGNMVNAIQGGILLASNVDQYAADIGSAVKELYKHHKDPVLAGGKDLVSVAYKYGVLDPVMGKADTDFDQAIFYKSVLDAVNKQPGDQPLSLTRMMTSGYDGVRHLGNKATHAYDLATDRIHKLGAFKHMTDRAMGDPQRYLGVDPEGLGEDLTKVSNEVLLDKARRWAARRVRGSFTFPDDVGTFVSKARTSYLGMFARYLTFTSEQARIAANSMAMARSEPGHVANLGVWAAAFGAAGLGLIASRQSAGISQAECDAAVRAQGGNRDAGLLCLPVRDSVTGRPTLLNVSNIVEPLRYVAGMNSDKSLKDNVARGLGNVALAPVSGGAVERPVRAALTSAFGENVFGFSQDKKINDNDPSYVKLMTLMSDAGLLPRGVSLYYKDLYALKGQGVVTPMSSGTFGAREALGLNVPRSIGAKEAAQQLQAKKQFLYKELKGVYINRALAKDASFVDKLLERTKDIVAKHRESSVKGKIAEVERQQKILAEGEKRARLSKGNKP